MYKLLLLYNLSICTLITIMGMFTAKNWNQLLFAAMFIPLTLYFLRSLLYSSTRSLLSPIAQNILPYTYYPNSPSSGTLNRPLQPTNSINDGLSTVDGEELSAHEVSDINRRLFLKLIGTAGLTTFLFALFTKSSQAAFFGSVPGPGTVSLKDSHGAKIDPAEKQPTDGYEVCDIDDASIPAYYGFMNADGAWYIAREGNGGEYRYRRGSGNFAASWAIHDELSYQYFNDVF